MSEAFPIPAESRVTYAETDEQTDSIEERQPSAVEQNEEIVALIRAHRAGTEVSSCGKGSRPLTSDPQDD